MEDPNDTKYTRGGERKLFRRLQISVQKLGVERVHWGGRSNPSWFVDTVINFIFVKTTLPLFYSSAFPSCTSTEPEFFNFYGLLSPDFVPAARLYRLAESALWNRFLGSLNVYKFGLR